MTEARSFYHELSSPVSAEVAWEALSHMDEWLENLSTIKAVSWDNESDGLQESAKTQTRTEAFFVEGRHYKVYTPEGVCMHARLSRVDTEAQKLQVDAQAGPLRSRLVCQVVSEAPSSQVNGASSCKLTRRQSYPGIMGRLFCALKARREDAETLEYLKAWDAFARALKKA